MAAVATPDCAVQTLAPLMVRTVIYSYKDGNCDGVYAVVCSELNPLR
jgi:hypothetical protein